MLSTQLAFDLITNLGCGVNGCGRCEGELYLFGFTNQTETLVGEPVLAGTTDRVFLSGITVVPEPGTAPLLGMGMGLLAHSRRRTR